MNDEDGVTLYGNQSLAQEIWDKAGRKMGVEPEKAQLYARTLPEHDVAGNTALLADQRALAEAADALKTEQFLADQTRLGDVLAALKGAEAIDAHNTERVGGVWRTTVKR